ncbi:MAG: hypothetical protein M3N19_03585, partial [Candidatus Eremiobacteraeota bacterium]|nr:hypothetical protein [Candidatus Eremiobacteraeota bacterium]
ALGLTRKHYAFVVGDEWQNVTKNDTYNTVEYLEAKQPGAVAAFVGFIEDPEMTPSRTRVALRIPDPADLKRWAAFLSEIGAVHIELSEDMDSYPAIFFEDAAGTKLEICARPAS